MSEAPAPPRSAATGPCARPMLPFALVAVAGLASVALPGPPMDATLFAVASAITAVMLGFGVLAVLRHRERWMIVILPFGYLVVAALLRHASEGSASGFLPLVLLPIVWLAVFGSRREMIAGLVAMAIALLVPFVVFGEPHYPPSALRSALLFADGRGADGADDPVAARPGARGARPPRRDPRDGDGDLDHRDRPAAGRSRSSTPARSGCSATAPTRSWAWRRRR